MTGRGLPPVLVRLMPRASGADRVVPPSHGLQLAQDLPAATCVILPDCGHNPHEEIPHKSMEIINDFFRKNPVDS